MSRIAWIAAELLARCTARVETLTSHGWRWRGTAFFVGSHTLLTCAHVVAGPGRLAAGPAGRGEHAQVRHDQRSSAGLGGTITYTPNSITVTLDRPGQPRVARALALLLAEINTSAPTLPGDGRPIT